MMYNTNEVICCFLERLKCKKETILYLLLTVETTKTAEDEYSRCLKYLQNIEGLQREYIIDEITGVGCSYLPLNQPLYSFVLSVFTLSLSCEKVYYRPPKQLWELHRSLFDCIKDILPNIYICTVSRKVFFEQHVQSSDIVVYTGRYDNVLDLRKLLRDDSLLVYNGSALNPIIVTKSADILYSANSVVNARLYNSGQDCMAPAAIFVYDDISEIFIKTINEELCKMKDASGEWNKSLIGPMISEKCYNEDMDFLNKYGENVVSGGETSDGLMISPTVFLFDGYRGEQQEILYAPFFCIYKYNDYIEILRYLNTDKAKCFQGYISVFADSYDMSIFLSTIREIDNLIILKNVTLLEYEDGNVEFGGYGEGCSFVYANGKVDIHPILLLREVFNWRKKNC